MVCKRPENYKERRQDDYYNEPRVILLVGTAHVSALSARDVERVVQVSLSLSFIVTILTTLSAASQSMLAWNRLAGLEIREDMTAVSAATSQLV